jgi:hypothetical protein
MGEHLLAEEKLCKEDCVFRGGRLTRLWGKALIVWALKEALNAQLPNCYERT